MLDIIQKYPRAIFYAVIVHVVLIALMVVSFKLTDKPAFESKDKGEEIIHAVTVDAKKIDKELKKIKKAERKKQRELERAAKKAEKARLREEKKLADTRKRRIAEQKSLEKKRQQEQQRLKALEAQRKQEEDRLQRLEQKKREEELRNKLQAEQERMELESDKQKQSMINQYRAMIEAKVRQNWIIPASAKEGMSCEIQVRLIPSGDVIQVQLTKTSGDSTFDRSVENAVHKASPLPVPPAESGLFDVFRDLKFPFTLEKKN